MANESTKSQTKPAKVAVKKQDYPDVPDVNNLETFDVGIQEEPRSHFHTQLAVYLLFLVVMALVVAYILVT